MAAQGVIGVRKIALLNVVGAGTQVIEAAVAGKMIQVDALWLSCDNALSLPLFEGSSGTDITGFLIQSVGVVALAAGANGAPLFWTAIGEGLTLRTAGAGTVGGFVTYRIVSV